MIIKKNTDSQVLFVTQTDHAKLSHDLAQKMLDKRVSKNVLKAIKHHDDGWEDWDQSMNSSMGNPTDYRNMNLTDHLSILRKSINICTDLNPYTGWLVSKHGCSFHKNKETKQARNFLRKEEKRRNDLLKENEIPPTKQRSKDFDRLQFFDALSLFIIDPWANSLNWTRQYPYDFYVEVSDKLKFEYRTSENFNESYKFSYYGKIMERSKLDTKKESLQSINSFPEQHYDVSLKHK